MRGIALICYTEGESGNPERTTMKNYFEGIGFVKEVPEVILDASIYAWSKFDLSLRKEISNEYMIISTENTDNAIQFELLTGIELYSVRFDGKLTIKRAGKQLNYNSTIPTNIAMYIFVEMMSRITSYRKIADVNNIYGPSKLYNKVPVYLIGWLADLVCWKDKSYTLSEANHGSEIKTTVKDTTVVIKFTIDSVKYRLFYEVDNDYEEIVLKANRKKVDVVDLELANFIVIKLSECFRRLVENAEEAGIVCNA